jgi:hypothetical protein
VRARKTTAAAVGPGRKTIGRGPHVSEGGEGKAGWDGWPVGQRGGEGRWATAGSKTGNGPKFQKEILFEFQFILEIW